MCEAYRRIVGGEQERFELDERGGFSSSGGGMRTEKRLGFKEESHHWRPQRDFMLVDRRVWKAVTQVAAKRAQGHWAASPGDSGSVESSVRFVVHHP